jgi:hypothetical protein
MQSNIKIVALTVDDGNTTGAPKYARPGTTEFTGIIGGGIRE